MLTSHIVHEFGCVDFAALRRGILRLLIPRTVARKAGVALAAVELEDARAEAAGAVASAARGRWRRPRSAWRLLRGRRRRWTRRCGRGRAAVYVGGAAAAGARKIAEGISDDGDFAAKNVFPAAELVGFFVRPAEEQEGLRIVVARRHLDEFDEEFERRLRHVG